MNLAIGLLFLGGVIALSNWFCLYKRHRIGRGYSSVPLIGGVLLVTGMWMLPATRPYAWAGIFLDYGTLNFALGLPRLANELWRTSRFNLLTEYVGHRGSMAAHLRLFRKGHFTLVQRIDRPPGTMGIIKRSMPGTWQPEGNRVILRHGAEMAILEVLEKEPEALQWTAGFPSTERNEELSLAGVILRAGQAG
jgi:hypothetical protein